MSDFAFDLLPMWIAIIAFSVFFYVLLDGFDLGIGILYGFVPQQERPKLMAAIAPIWDGNETWLILGALALLVVFPLAFAIIIPAVYFPVLLMLLALVFRGVAFEFRFEQPWLQRFWSRGFCVGSTLASFAQGAVLGAFIQGFSVSGRAFSGTSWDWLTPFSIMTGLALTTGYSLLGACWLIVKCEGALRDWARRAGRRCCAGVLLAILLVSLWTPVMNPAIAARWFSFPNILWLAPLPITTVTLAYRCWTSLSGRGSDVSPFFAAMGLFLMSYLGVAISLWPMIVPGHYSVWEAEAPPSTQAFLMVGTLFLLPIILTYVAWSYWVFRGKLKPGVGYH